MTETSDLFSISGLKVKALMKSKSAKVKGNGPG